MTIKELFDKTKHYFFKKKDYNYCNGVECPLPSVSNQFCKDGKDILKADKKWGAELIICKAPHAAKIMVLEPGCQVSLHWHEAKAESFILIEGELVIETIIIANGHEDIVMLENKFDSITLPPRVPHTFYCPDDQGYPTIFIEASTEDRAYDNYRIFPSRGKDVNSGGSDS